MTTIRDVIEAEEKKMTWLDKIVRNYPKVHQTSFLSAPLKQSQPEVVIRPSILEKLLTIPFFFFALVFYLYFFKALITKELPIIIPIAGILFVSFILYLTIWHSFLNPKYIYQIRINKQFLEAQGHKFYWVDIADTCILSKMEGRSSNNYLVIIMRNGTIKKLNLFKFRFSETRLAGIVEFYKHE